MRGEDLLLLAHLEDPKNLTQLAEETHRDASRLSRVVRELERLHLVRIDRDGREILVRRDGLAANVLTQVLQDYPHQPWAELLTEPNLELVSFFSSPADNPLSAQLTPAAVEHRTRPYVPKTLRDASSWTGYSTDHARRLIDKLLERAILRRADDALLLAPEHVKLREFAKLYHQEWAWSTLRDVSRTANPIWQLGRGILFTTREPVSGFPKGGMSLAGDHGVPVVADHHTYVRAPWMPSVSDAILQTYLEGPTRTSNVVYACILYAKHRPPDFLDRARQYGIPIPAKLIASYAEAPGSHTGGGFPPANEYREIARPYGVT
ncbi:MAG TPA: hypothetical protein VGB18_08260 [Candidatus Thermoplasmatota archaeon]